MKNKAVWALVALLAISLSGCASVQKKFTRKKPEKRAQAAVYLQEGAYQKQYTNDYYYKIHYSQWGNWQDELLLQLGGNRKKLKRCAQEALGQLSDMARYLKEEKAAELKPYIDELKKITEKIEGGSYSQSEEGMIRTDAERIKRLVSSNFYYEKVKDSVLPDQVDLGQ